MPDPSRRESRGSAGSQPSEPQPSDSQPSRSRLLGLPSWPQAQHVAGILRDETVGGILLLAGALIALTWANSPWRESYHSLVETSVGPGSLHLHLSLEQWAADGLLAIFFFVVGLELKREFLLGDLRSVSRAVLPVVAAVGGMVTPVLIYLLVNTVSADGSSTGWAVPTATDIAFAVAVLAIIGAHLPAALRSFLLTLAVVDDLLAIAIIALFFTDHLSPGPALASLALIVVFGLLVNRSVPRWWLLVPLAVAAWAFMHASGIHATIAGVLLGFTVPARPGPGEQVGRSERFEHFWRPVSAGVAVPLFALMAAGVSLLQGGIGGAFTDPIAIGVALGLLLGKPIGVLGSTWLLARFTRAELDSELSWWDVFGVALLAGVGFTVCLLLGELAFDDDAGQANHVKIAIFVGSVAAAMFATIVLRARNRVYRRLAAEETVDLDADGIPDIYQTSEADQRGR
ncbi:Na+/H+ antiporter NhaA [Frankia sp. R43]|uniref:Na+/H+ antiporter NhaA n=1 Tax=Frankia sp. R43 TaxID=269536 RepID=UPI0009FA0DDB|nr:Na+/H+ antiporter NhaA [Frankia sp. R43]